MTAPLASQKRHRHFGLRPPVWSVGRPSSQSAAHLISQPPVGLVGPWSVGRPSGQLAALRSSAAHPVGRPPIRLVSRWSGRSAAGPVGRPSGWPPVWSAGQSATRPVGLPLVRSVCRPSGWLATRPVGRSAARPVGRPSGRLPVLLAGWLPICRRSLMVIVLGNHDVFFLAQVLFPTVFFFSSAPDNHERLREATRGYERQRGATRDNT